MKPKISVITINYNNKSGLERTLKSVMSQTYKDFEYLVIDGGSQDGSKELIEKYADQISYWVSEPDKGIYNAMNKGIKKASGEYLFYLNSGDQFCDSQSLSKAAVNVNIEDIIYFNIQVVDEKERFIKDCPPILDFHFFYNDTLPHQATFMKASSFKIVGFYDESIQIISDWKWYLDAIFTYSLSYKKVDEVFSIYYLDGISSDPLSYPFFRKERKRILNSSFPYLISEYKLRMEANLKLEGYESSRVIKVLKKIGFLKGLK